MPGSRWTDERRAKFNATIAAKQAAGRMGWSEERRARQEATLAKLREERIAAGWRPPQPTKGRISSIEDRLAAVEYLLFGLDDPVASALEEIRRSVRDVAAKQGKVVEWRPDHRRHADGGTPVRDQRKAAGVPRRPLKAEVTRVASKQGSRAS